MCLFLANHGQAWPISLRRMRPMKKCVCKQDLRQSDKVEVDVKWSRCVYASTAAPWCLILFKSGLRKNQSCCWPSLFGAPGVSIASGHETHRIYGGDREGVLYNAWWSASDLHHSLTCLSVGRRKGVEETSRKDGNKYSKVANGEHHSLAR